MLVSRREALGMVPNCVMSGVLALGAETALAQTEVQDPTTLVPEQIQANRKIALLEQIRQSSGFTDVQVGTYRSSDVANEKFAYLVQNILFPPQSRNGSIRFSVEEKELYFTRFRLQNVLSLRSLPFEVRQDPNSEYNTMPVYTNDQVEGLLKGVTANSLQSIPFEPYSTSWDRYSDKYGSTALLVDRGGIPDDHFLFVLSHNMGADRWIQRPDFDAFGVSVEGMPKVFVNMESYNPSIDLYPDKPGYTHDQAAIFVSDLSGKLLVGARLQFAHYAVPLLELPNNFAPRP